MNMKHKDAAALERRAARLQPPAGGGFAGHGKSCVAKIGKAARARSKSNSRWAHRRGVTTAKRTSCDSGNRIDSSFRKMRRLFSENMRKIATMTPTQVSSPPVTMPDVAAKGHAAPIGVGVMRFLLRVAFWLSVVIVLLPAAPTKEKAANQVGAAEAVSAASAAVSDMKQFCTRQPEACEVGSHAISTFGQKAQAGAKMLYEFLTDRFGQEQTGSVGAVRPDNSQNTLTPADLAPEWRGPQPVREAGSRRPA